MPSQRPHWNLSPAIIISRSVTPVMRCMWFATGAPMQLRMFMKLIETAL